ncbi:MULTISPECIES: glucosaminidase domain-containing protein [unclassified Exiguobacterium]|uniref:N-acetylglucosaminidase n=1 Tax=unclassified Exiguobacterium TaxID=2644629 RepID=UPI00203732FB|nr:MULTISPECIES: glucosaminidase domain-containing protein [unclassified Exiguobacterium]
MKRKKKRTIWPMVATLSIAVAAFLWIQSGHEDMYTVETMTNGDRVTRSFESLDEAKRYMTSGKNRTLFSPSGEVLDFTGTGIVVTPSDAITNLYEDEAFKKRQSYVAGGTRLQLIERGNGHLKVRISGADVYVKPDQMALFPEAVVERRGYYEIRDGDVYHSVEANGHLAGKFLVGPTKKRSDDRYYTERVQDVFDSPYQFASIRSSSPYTTKEFDQYLRSIDSPLAGEGKAFKRAEDTYGINALFLLAVAGHESRFGTSDIAREKRNLFGFRATDDNPSENATMFKTIDASVQAAAELFATKYVKGPYARGDYPGNKQEGINIFYASDPYWGEKVAGTMYTIDRELGLKQLKQIQ